MLLGAPFSKRQAMDNSLSSQCNDLERPTSRLELITAHDALVFLRTSFSAPKLQHIMRISPCYDNEHLLKFDELLRTAISNNIYYISDNVSLSDDQWLQASLPVKVWQPEDSSCVFTCITCFPSISCEHTRSPEPDFTYGYDHA